MDSGGAPVGSANAVRFTVGQATVATVAAQGVGAVAAVAATPYLVRELGVAPYGIVLATLVLATQLTPLYLGVPAAAVRLIAASRGRGDPRRHAALLLSLSLLAIFTALLVGVGFVLVAPWVWRSSFQATPELFAQARAALPAAAALVIAQPLMVVAQAALMGEERFGALSTLRGIQGLGRTGLAVATVAAGGGVAGVLWVQAASDALIAGVAAVWGRRRTFPRVPAKEVADAARELGSLGLPFAIVDGLAAILLDIEKLVLGMLRTASDLTFYMVPFHAAFRLTLLTSALASVLIPRISGATSAGERLAAGALMARANRMTAVAMTGLLGLLVALTPELLTLWLGTDFAEASGLATRIILIALLANAGATAAHAALRAVERPVVLAALYSAELVVHAAVVFVAIGWWGVTGAAVAWATRAVLDAVAQRVLAVRALGVSIGPWREYWVPLLAVTALAAVSELPPLSLPWIARTAVAVSVAAATAIWLLRDEDRKLLVRLLRPWGGPAT